MSVVEVREDGPVTIISINRPDATYEQSFSAEAFTTVTAYDVSRPWLHAVNSMPHDEKS